MTRGTRGRRSARRRDDAELDALLTQAWDDGVAALARTLDTEAGRAALLTAASSPGWAVSRRSGTWPG